MKWVDEVAEGSEGLFQDDGKVVRLLRHAVHFEDGWMMLETAVNLGAANQSGDDGGAGGGGGDFGHRVRGVAGILEDGRVQRSGRRLVFAVFVDPLGWIEVHRDLEQGKCFGLCHGHVSLLLKTDDGGIGSWFSFCFLKDNREYELGQVSRTAIRIGELFITGLFRK